MGPSGEFPIGIPIQTAFLGWFHVEQSPSCGDGQHGPAAEASKNFVGTHLGEVAAFKGHHKWEILGEGITLKNIH